MVLCISFLWGKLSIRILLVSRQTQIEFSCSSDIDEEIWVLLTRHVVDTRRSTDFIALRVELEDDFVQATDVVESQRALSMKVIIDPCRSSIDQWSSIIQGTYTNSTHVLVRRSFWKYNCMYLINGLGQDANTEISTFWEPLHFSFLRRWFSRGWVHSDCILHVRDEHHMGRK